MQVKTNIVFKHLEECKTPIIIEQGGSRSGKTYNILIWIITKCLGEWNNKVIDIVRKSFPSLRASVMFDFIKILKDMNLYSEKDHNKTENTYKLSGNTIRFFSCDDAQKMRGPGRNILFCNEANELLLEDFRQLNMRTSELAILDYNPSDEFHWIYEQLLVQEDVTFHKTTYQDNPFLEKRIIKEIEKYKEIDENYWRIYGLGERGISQTTIFKNWEIYHGKEPDGSYEEFYGLDFGFNHPTAIVKIKICDGWVYACEKLYKTGLTGVEIIEELKNLGLSWSDTIFADCARPEMIEEIARAGFNIHPTMKGKNSVVQGIDVVKRNKIYVDSNSTNLIREMRNYKWKVNKDEQVLDEPVKINDDAVDALRYAFNDKIKPKESFGEVFSFEI